MDVRKRAFDLIKKFDVKYYYKLTKGQFPVSMHNSVIKECVLNAIDEIIKVFYFINPNSEDLVLLGELKYWQEVKEIVTAEFDQLYQAVP